MTRKVAFCIEVELILILRNSLCCSQHGWQVNRDPDDVIKWKHFPRYWPFVRGILQSPVNFRHKGQWRGALVFSLICAWIIGWVNNREAGDLRPHRAHYDVIVMPYRHPDGCLFITGTSTAKSSSAFRVKWYMMFFAFSRQLCKWT